MPHLVVRYARYARTAAIIALFGLAAILGTVSGVLFAYAGDLPEISALDNYAPNTITRVTAANGQVIGEFATERRDVIGYTTSHRICVRPSSRQRTATSIATSA